MINKGERIKQTIEALIPLTIERDKLWLEMEALDKKIDELTD